jgi:hypothetical protein
VTVFYCYIDHERKSFITNTYSTVVMSRVQNKKIYIDLTLSSEDEDEMLDSVIKAKPEFPKLPREIWLKIWSFEFGDDAEQYTNKGKNLLKRKEYGRSIKTIRDSIQNEELTIHNQTEKIILLQFDVNELYTVFTPENYRIWEILSTGSKIKVNWERRKKNKENKLRNRIEEEEDYKDDSIYRVNSFKYDIRKLQLKIEKLSYLCNFIE